SRRASSTTRRQTASSPNAPRITTSARDSRTASSDGTSGVIVSAPSGGGMRKVRVAPKGMGIHEFVAQERGFFADEGIEVEFDWKTFRGTQSSWKQYKYLERPQDKPYTEDQDRSLIQCACVWGSISNASAGMGRFVPDAYGVSPWAIFVRPDSAIRRPEDLKDVPVSVGLRAGSHFNVPYRLEKYLPLEHIKTV